MKHSSDPIIKSELIHYKKISLPMDMNKKEIQSHIEANTWFIFYEDISKIKYSYHKIRDKQNSENILILSYIKKDDFTLYQKKQNPVFFRLSSEYETLYFYLNSVNQPCSSIAKIEKEKLTFVLKDKRTCLFFKTIPLRTPDLKEISYYIKLLINEAQLLFSKIQIQHLSILNCTEHPAQSLLHFLSDQPIFVIKNPENILAKPCKNKTLIHGNLLESRGFKITKILLFLFLMLMFILFFSNLILAESIQPPSKGNYENSRVEILGSYLSSYQNSKPVYCENFNKKEDRS